MSDNTAGIIDPGAVWDALPPEQQRQIGVAALVIAHAWAREDAVDEPRYDAHGVACDFLGLSALSSASARLTDPGRVIDLGALGVRMCHRCGCTEDAACEGGCSWVGDHLCSSCAPEPVP